MNCSRVFRYYKIYIQPDLDEGFFSTVSGIDTCTKHGKTAEDCFEKTKQFIIEYLEAKKYLKGNPQMTFERITDWINTAANLKQYKASEAKQRIELCKEIFEGRTGKFTAKKLFKCIPPDETEGPFTASGTLELEIVAKSTTSFKVDEEELQNLKDQGLLTEIDESCFERKLSVKDGALRKLPKDSVVWRAITEKPGMPTLEVRKVHE
jgi:predicted RNase H-like HicB family nuclease